MKTYKKVLSLSLMSCLFTFTPVYLNQLNAQPMKKKVSKDTRKIFKISKDTQKKPFKSFYSEIDKVANDNTHAGTQRRVNVTKKVLNYLDKKMERFDKMKNESYGKKVKFFLDEAQKMYKKLIYDKDKADKFLDKIDKLTNGEVRRDRIEKARTVTVDENEKKQLRWLDDQIPELRAARIEFDHTGVCRFFADWAKSAMDRLGIDNYQIYVPNILNDKEKKLSWGNHIFNTFDYDGKYNWKAFDMTNGFVHKDITDPFPSMISTKIGNEPKIFDTDTRNFGGAITRIVNGKEALKPEEFSLVDIESMKDFGFYVYGLPKDEDGRNMISLSDFKYIAKLRDEYDKIENQIKNTKNKKEIERLKSDLHKKYSEICTLIENQMKFFLEHRSVIVDREKIKTTCYEKALEAYEQWEKLDKRDLKCSFFFTQGEDYYGEWKKLTTELDIEKVNALTDKKKQLENELKTIENDLKILNDRLKS